MKLFSIFIALAMLTMLMEGCGRYTEDGQTIGQKRDRVLARTSNAIIEAGDSLGSKAEQAHSSVSSVASSISDGALIATLAVADSAITASIKTDLIRDPDLNALKIDVQTRN